MIIINSKDIDITTAMTYDAQVLTCTTVFENSTAAATVSKSGSWISDVTAITGYSDGTNYYQNWSIRIAKNDTDKVRVGTLTFSGTDASSEEQTATFEINQGGSLDYLIPIWKDVYFTKMIEELDYEIHYSSDTIYEGRALMKPDGSEGVRIDISRIAQDYLDEKIDKGILDIDHYFTFINSGATGDFTLNFYDTDVMVYHYINDWTYDSSISYPMTGSTLMSHPINGHADSRMLLPFTMYNGVGKENEEFTIDGEESPINFERDNCVCSVFFDASEIYDSVYNDTGKAKYTVGKCGDYALYYRNRQGGYDAFLIEGIGKKTDSYDKYSMDRSYDNNSIDFEENTYHTQISSTYELKTNWLSDSQAENLAENLLSSNEVYLHILNNNRIIPVVITADSAEHKTYKNTGRNLVSYTINCKESQKKQLQ